MTKRIMSVAIALVAVCVLAAVTTGLTARPHQEQEKVTPPGVTDALPPGTAQGDLMWFTNLIEFQKFNSNVGNVFIGVEDFEESILPPISLDAFDDPLESGLLNLPDGFPFPNGMTGLPNLRVQSNTLGGDPDNESPRGVDGLLAVSVGKAGAVTDIVVALFDFDSLDLIFTDEKSGVGFNTITFGPGPRLRSASIARPTCSWE